MILMNRIVARFLMAGLLVVFLSVVASRCPADDLEEALATSPAVVESVAETQSKHVHSEGCSNFAIAKHWLRFAAPETFRVARKLVVQTKSTVVRFQREQEIQQGWVRQQWERAIERGRLSVGRLAAAWLPRQDSPHVAKVDLFLEKHESLFGQESAASAYWGYYAACDRWGVELTSTINDDEAKNEPVAGEVANVSNEVSAVQIDAAAQSDSLTEVLNGWNWTSDWLGKAIRQIEFVAIESPKPSGDGLSSRLY